MRTMRPMWTFLVETADVVAGMDGSPERGAVPCAAVNVEEDPRTCCACEVLREDAVGANETGDCSRRRVLSDDAAAGVKLCGADAWDVRAVRFVVFAVAVRL